MIINKHDVKYGFVCYAWKTIRCFRPSVRGKKSNLMLIFDFIKIKCLSIKFIFIMKWSIWIEFDKRVNDETLTDFLTYLLINYFLASSFYQYHWTKVTSRRLLNIIDYILEGKIRRREHSSCNQLNDLPVIDLYL